MSATARAEARRKAILSRGTDRLAKLTTSARGEDNEVYKTPDPPLPSLSRPTVDSFVGDETDMPTPPLSNGRGQPASMNTFDANTMSAQEQQEFLRALMSGVPGMNMNAGQNASGFPQLSADHSFESSNDPMAAMMAAMSKFPSQQGFPGVDSSSIPGHPTMTIPVPPKTKLQKLMPLLHLIATWCLLAYFALFREPGVYAERVHVGKEMTVFQRWAELGWRSPDIGITMQPVPLFWAFTTLQLVIHSTMLFTRSDPIQPPTMVALALPHLPPQVATILMNVLRYLKMAGVLLDNVAGLVVGVGILIWVAAWLEL